MRNRIIHNIINAVTVFCTGSWKLFTDYKTLKLIISEYLNWMFFFSTELAGPPALESLLEIFEDTPFKKQ